MDNDGVRVVGQAVVEMVVELRIRSSAHGVAASGGDAELLMRIPVPAPG